MHFSLSRQFFFFFFFLADGLMRAINRGSTVFRTVVAYSEKTLDLPSLRLKYFFT